MESWRLVWREGFAPVLPTEALEALAAALLEDDPRLIQGATSQPPPLLCVQDWLVEAGCAVGYCGAAVSGGLACTAEEARAAGSGQVPHTNPHAALVGAVEEFFARACFDADQLLGEPAACRWFLNWFDDTPRDEMRRELLAECELALSQRVKPLPTVRWAPSTLPALAGHLCVGSAVYAVAPVPAGEPVLRAFQLRKVRGGTDAEATGYAVRVTAAGVPWSCECKSWLVRGACKHAREIGNLVAGGAL